MKGLEPETAALLGELAVKEDQIKGEDLGRPRTAADAAHALSDLLGRPGVHDLRLQRTIRKILLRTDIAKSPIGVVRADIERHIEASSDASPSSARSLARGGSYGQRGAFVEDGAPSPVPSLAPDGSYVRRGVFVEDGAPRDLSDPNIAAREARRLAHHELRKAAETDYPHDSYVQFGVRIDSGFRPHPKQHAYWGPSRDLRISEKGVLYELLQGERTEDKFADAYCPASSEADIPCGLAERDAAHARLEAESSDSQLEAAPR